jgi:pseudaminic acid synthase
MLNNFEKIIESKKTYIIAEMSANHAGDLEIAKELVHVAKNAGADCIKTQTYTPDTLTIKADTEYFKIKEGTWKGENIYNLYSRAYMPWEWNKILKEEADKVGIDFLSSVYDRTSFDYLEDLNLDVYKIASFEFNDISLIEYIAKKNKGLILSTGMASEEDIHETLKVIRKYNNNIVLLKCSSAYPAVHKDMNLATMKYMAEKFDVEVGFSDHSQDSISAITAVALGARVIEKHICLSKEIVTADSSFSLTPDEFKTMVENIRLCEETVGNVTFERSEREQKSSVFKRSIFAIKDIEIGDLLSEDNIGVIRPGYGLHPKHYDNLLGKKSNFCVQKGYPITDKWL